MKLFNKRTAFIFCISNEITKDICCKSVNQFLLKVRNLIEKARGLKLLFFPLLNIQYPDFHDLGILFKK